MLTYEYTKQTSKAMKIAQGFHVVGSDAGEIIQGMVVTIRVGATKAVFDSTIGIHATTAEEVVYMRKSVG